MCLACILRIGPPGAVRWFSAGRRSAGWRRCIERYGTASCRVGFVRVCIVPIVGGVLCRGGISGARLHWLCSGGGHARVAVHMPVHMPVHSGGSGRYGLTLLRCSSLARYLRAALCASTLTSRAGRGLPHGQQLRQQGKVEQQELKCCRRFGALHYAALRVKSHLPCRMQVCGRKAGRYLLPHGGFVCWQAQTGHNGLAALAQQKQVAQVARQFAHKKADVHALLQNLRAEVCYGGAVLPVQGGKQLGKQFLPRKAQHLPRGGHGQLLTAQGEGLVEQRHAVAHAACGAAGDKAHRPFFKGGVFLAQHGGKVRIQRLFAQVTEYKVLAAAHNGNGKLVRLCGGKDKDHAFRRLFQRLQQGVEGVAGEHVGFVDDKNLVATFHGRVADGFA